MIRAFSTPPCCSTATSGSHALASRATKLLEQASAWYADVKKL
ncbi:MAG: hypothetical protein ACLSHC_06120 [Bilophila wadsworthia]